jgi:SAM-dependent methyltransferase
MRLADWVKESSPGVVRRAAGRLSRLRHRGAYGRPVWDRELPHEADYWREFLATQKRDVAWRSNPRSQVPSHSPVSRLLSEMPQEDVAILDVGAGPLTTVGQTYPGKRLHITAVDPLAEHFDAILAEAGIEPPARTEPGEGEHLVEQFGRDRFDVVCCFNALDHAYEPLAVIDNMLDVARRGGFVVLEHRRNEAEHQLYRGLHQWNIDCRDDRFVIWSSRETVDVTERLRGVAKTTAWIEADRVLCVLEKR